MARNNTNDTTKPLAKSLHTISVLVNLGLFLYETRTGAPSKNGPKASARAALDHALAILGHAGKADPYGLAEISVDQLAARIKADKGGEQ